METSSDAQVGVVNVQATTTLDAALARVDELETNLAAVQNTMRDLNVKIGSGGDSIGSWIAAVGAWIVYPLVWRPLRQRQERRKKDRHASGFGFTTVSAHQRTDYP